MMAYPPVPPPPPTAPPGPAYHANLAHGVGHMSMTPGEGSRRESSLDREYVHRPMANTSRRLSINLGGKASSSATTKHTTTHKTDAVDPRVMYVQYTLRKVDLSDVRQLPEGRTTTWNVVSRKRDPLSSAELKAAVIKKKTKGGSAEKDFAQSGMTEPKERSVRKLLNDLNLFFFMPGYHWVLKSINFDVKNKVPVAMHVIVKREVSPNPYQRPPVWPEGYPPPFPPISDVRMETQLPPAGMPQQYHHQYEGGRPGGDGYASHQDASPHDHVGRYPRGNLAYEINRSSPEHDHDGKAKTKQKDKIRMPVLLHQNHQHSAAAVYDSDSSRTEMSDNDWSSDSSDTDITRPTVSSGAGRNHRRGSSSAYRAGNTTEYRTHDRPKPQGRGPGTGYDPNIIHPHRTTGPPRRSSMHSNGGGGGGYHGSRPNSLPLGRTHSRNSSYGYSDHAAANGGFHHVAPLPLQGQGQGHGHAHAQTSMSPIIDQAIDEMITDRVRERLGGGSKW